MKRIKKLFLILLLIMPVYIGASSKKDYASSVNEANNYTSKNFASSYTKYIQNIPGVKFISKDEYNASKNNNGMSYLNDGFDMFTNSEEGSNVYVVKSNGSVKLESKSKQYNSRVTEYVKPGIKVKGTGSYGNPWYFDQVYSVRIKVNSKYATVSGDTQDYVSRGSATTFAVSAKEGFMYLNNDCGATYSNGYLTISNVKRNLVCSVVFGTGNFKIELEGANPNKIYLKYKDNYYKDETYSRTISSLNTVPEKIGYTFAGYKYNEYLVVDENMKIVRSSADKIMEDVKLTPMYEIKNPEAPTISGGTTKVFNRANTVLTCATTSSYASDTNLYYEFGYATSNGGTVTWMGNASTSPTYSVEKDAFYGSLYYKCRVYAVNGAVTTQKIESEGSTTMTHVNARLDLDANGGTLSGNSPVYVAYGRANYYDQRTSGTVANLPTVQRDGWAFSGWYTEATGGTKVINANGTIVASVSGWTNASSQFVLTKTSNTANTNKLYAQYNGNTYTATFNKNGATSLGSTSLSCTVSSGSSCSVTAPAITRSGFTIVGYNTSSSATTSTQNVGSSIALTGNRTYYAITSKKVTITFDKNGNTSQTPSGGSASTANTITQDCTIWNTATNCSITSPTITASSGGYVSQGYSASAANHTITWNSNAAKNMTDSAIYYAQSMKTGTTFTITFNRNGNASQTPSGGSASTANTITQSCITDSGWNGGAVGTSCTVKSPTITAPSNFTVIGYSTAAGTHSSGWNQNTNKTISASATYYAQSSRTFTVTYSKGSNVSNIGSTSGSCTVYNGGTSCNVTLPTITANTGHTSAGWSTTNGATTGTAAGSNYSISGNTTLYANATANKYKVTYNVNGGSGTIAATEYTYASSGNVALSTTKPTRSGYVFAGWGTASNSVTVSYASGGNFPKSTASNTTLYAIWYTWSNNDSPVEYYKTLASAVDGTTAGKTIKLAISYSDSSAVSIAKSLTINLNGYTLTRDKTLTIANAGNVTFNGSGTYTTSAGVPITNNGTLAISNGTITTSANTNVIVNNKTLTISGKDTAINQTKGNSGVINSGTMTISNGTVQNTSGVFDIAAIENRGTLSMSGGTVNATGECVAVWIPKDYTSAVFTLTGGTVKGKDDNAIWNEAGKTYLKGGTVQGEGDRYFVISSRAALEISGANVIQDSVSNCAVCVYPTSTLTMSSGGIYRSASSTKYSEVGKCFASLWVRGGTVTITGGTVGAYSNKVYGALGIISSLGGSVTINGKDATVRTYQKSGYPARTLHVQGTYTDTEINKTGYGTITYKKGTITNSGTNSDGCQVWKAAGSVFNNDGNGSFTYCP